MSGLFRSGWERTPPAALIMYNFLLLRLHTEAYAMPSLPDPIRQTHIRVFFRWCGRGGSARLCGSPRPGTTSRRHSWCASPPLMCPLLFSLAIFEVRTTFFPILICFLFRLLQSAVIRSYASLRYNFSLDVFNHDIGPLPFFFGFLSCPAVAFVFLFALMPVSFPALRCSLHLRGGAALPGADRSAQEAGRRADEREQAGDGRSPFQAVLLRKVKNGVGRGLSVGSVRCIEFLFFQERGFRGS